jgi:hypothetical protein
MFCSRFFVKIVELSTIFGNPNRMLLLLYLKRLLKFQLAEMLIELEYKIE